MALYIEKTSIKQQKANENRGTHKISEAAH